MAQLTCFCLYGMATGPGVSANFPGNLCVACGHNLTSHLSAAVPVGFPSTYPVPCRAAVPF